MSSRVAHRALLTVALAVLVSGTTGCSRAVSGHPLGLAGRWQSTGYQCPAGVIHHEVIDIAQHGSRLTATKVVGDKCVGSGHRTFQGVLTGTTGRVDCWLGSIGVTATIAVRNAPLTVLTPNKFTVAFAGDTITYTRTGAAPSTTDGSNWWVWLLLIVLVIVVALVAFAVRRMRRRRAAPA